MCSGVRNATRLHEDGASPSGQGGSRGRWAGGNAGAMREGKTGLTIRHYGVSISHVSPGDRPERNENNRTSA